MQFNPVNQLTYTLTGNAAIIQLGHFNRAVQNIGSDFNADKIHDLRVSAEALVLSLRVFETAARADGIITAVASPETPAKPTPSPAAPVVDSNVTPNCATPLKESAG